MICMQVAHRQVVFRAILLEQHKRPIFYAACLKSSQQEKEEERLLSQAQAASATIKTVERATRVCPPH